MAASIAPLITAWQRTHANVPGPFPAAGVPRFAFPVTPQEFRFEILVNGSWIEITPDVRFNPTVGLARGRPDEGKRVQRGLVSFTIDNTDGRYSPRNPTGPYYGLIGRNTPVRISARNFYRFHGEIVAWPAQWDRTGSIVWVEVEAVGVLQRLDQGAKPLKSPLRRAILASDPLAYWPGEDAAGSDSIASAVAGVAAMTVTGDATLGAGVAVAGSLPVVDLKDTGRVVGTIPAGSATSWRVECTFGFGEALAGAEPDVLTLRTGNTYWVVTAIGDAGIGLLIDYTTHPGSAGVIMNTISTTDTTVVTDQRAHHLRLDVEQSGAFIDVTVTVDSEVVATDTFAGTLERPSTWVVNYGAEPSGILPQVGHWAVWAPWAGTTDTAAAAAGHAGETAAGRLARLCAENGVIFVLHGAAADTAVLGPQQVDTLINLLHHAAEADQGILYEPREYLGLAYRTRTSLYNRASVLTLDYAAAHLFDGVAAVDDDQLVTNDVTAKRIGGSSDMYVIDTGPLSTQDPPNGVGVYDESHDYNVYADEQLRDIASVRAHIGTWDEARYPQITVALHSPDVVDPDLLVALVTADVGDRITVVNLPAWVPPEDVELMVQGSSESFSPHTWTITLNCVPYGPYRVYRIEDGQLGVLAPAGQTLDGEHAADDAVLSVTTATGYPLIATSLTSFVDIMIAGERMTVQGVVGASSPQLVTVTRAVNGVSKVLPAGSPVTLFPRTGLAR